MKQFFYAGFICLIFFSSCKESFKKYTDGTEYKIISNEKGKRILDGNYIEVEVLKKYKDSVIYNSRDLMPQFGVYDMKQFPPLYQVVFKNARVGDSIVTRILTDSLMKRGEIAPFEKKGEYEYTTYKITNAFTTKEQTDSAYNKWIPIAKARASAKIMTQIKSELQKNQAQLKTDDKILSDYIAAHKLSAVKAPWGTYVVITTPGTGDNLTDTSIAVVNYTGKTLDGTVFDSNTDPKFGHPEPISIDLSQLGSVILGWTEGLKMMKKGSKGMFLIPSTLAYGTKGSGDRIKPNENLLFDIEVVNVISQAQYQMEQMERQRKQMQMQQQMQQMQQMQQQQQGAPQQQAPQK